MKDTKTINFIKMSGSGNDFIVIDNANCKLQNAKLPSLAKKFCDRKYGIGADGLILIEKSKKADFKMRIFNPDGSEPDMCGNGARCAALYASLKFPLTPLGAGKVKSSKLKIETRAGMIRGEVKRNTVRIQITRPKNVKLDFKVGNYNVSFINTGVPHTVLFVKNLKEIDVVRIGKFIRFHKKFSPDGTNVNFVKVLNKKTLKIRTYERGVEEETLACGTGAVASGIIAGLKNKVSSPVSVITRGGEKLKVYFDKKTKKVCFEGIVKIVYEGKIGRKNWWGILWNAPLRSL